MIDVSDFTLTEDKKAEICKHMNEKQASRVRMWMDLQATLNAGDFDKMDTFFHPDFIYANPSRPDLGSYESWKTSPMELYKRFPPSAYVTLAATAKGDNEIWVHCRHRGALTGGNYMGQEPKGQEIDVQWFSTVKFKDDKIVHIFSIADVLGMMIDVGVIDPAILPTDPYK